jgi:hypothetical protein
MRDYMLVSPSLDGVLRHEPLVYGGINRPIEILRVFDSPASEEGKVPTEKEHEVLEQYFHDLYGVFMKKLSHLVVETDLAAIDTVKLQAMLQEMIKVKMLIVRKEECSDEVD